MKVTERVEKEMKDELLEDKLSTGKLIKNVIDLKIAELKAVNKTIESLEECYKKLNTDLTKTELENLSYESYTATSGSIPYKNKVYSKSVKPSVQIYGQALQAQAGAGTFMSINGTQRVVYSGNGGRYYINESGQTVYC